jgi:hypothetical protein
MPVFSGNTVKQFIQAERLPANRRNHKVAVMKAQIDGRSIMDVGFFSVSLSSLLKNPSVSASIRGGDVQEAQTSSRRPAAVLDRDETPAKGHGQPILSEARQNP